MSDKRCTDEFKQEAIKQITESGHLPVDSVLPPTTFIHWLRSMATTLVAHLDDQ